MGISPETQRILLIEPDDGMRDRVEAVLLGAGYDVTAPAGPEPPGADAGRRRCGGAGPQRGDG